MRGAGDEGLEKDGSESEGKAKFGFAGSGAKAASDAFSPSSPSSDMIRRMEARISSIVGSCWALGSLIGVIRVFLRLETPAATSLV